MSAYYSASVMPTSRRKVVTSSTRKAAFSRTGPVTAVGKAIAQFRPVPMEPPQRPVWVHEKTSANLTSQGPPPKTPEEFLKAKIRAERADVNYKNYQVYIRTYEAYVLQLEALKQRFWNTVKLKREGAKAPEGESNDAPPPNAPFKPSEPLDAAAMSRDKERRARRAAARRRQRAAKRERAREAKAKSLEVQVEVAKLENQLRRAKGANIVRTQAVPGKGSKAAGEKLAAGRGGPPPGSPPVQLLGAARNDNAATRRRKRRLEQFGVPGRTPDELSPSAET